MLLLGSKRSGTAHRLSPIPLLASQPLERVQQAALMLLLVIAQAKSLQVVLKMLPLAEEQIYLLETETLLLGIWPLVKALVTPEATTPL